MSRPSMGRGVHPRPRLAVTLGNSADCGHHAMEQVALADRLGIDYLWEVEHHFL